MARKSTPKPNRWTRDFIFDVLRHLDIGYIFGVPGTNEIPIIDGTSYPDNAVQYIQCLHENIAIGAAMGYARMSGKPGVIVVHVTPGIAHSIGNLFNAWRSRVPLVILCCQQQNELVTQEPLLASDLVDLARQYTKWAHEVRAPTEIPLVLQRAFKEAMAPPKGPVFLAIPWDFLIREVGAGERVAGITRVSSYFTGDHRDVDKAASVLAGSKNPVIVVGDAVGYAAAWEEVRQLAELLGAPVLTQSFSSLANFPNDDYHWQGELAADQGLMRKLFQGHDVAFLCGFSNQAQVTVFKYAEGPLIPTDVRQVYLTNNTWDIGKNYYGEAAILGDVKATLPLLNQAVAKLAPKNSAKRNAQLNQLQADRHAAWQAYLKAALAEKEIWAVVIADALRRSIDELQLHGKFVYVHEAVSDPAPFQYLLPFGLKTAAPTSYYCVGGGSLGWSMPASLGIKLVEKGGQGIETELVVNVVGDGSTLFYPQAWWTAAHRHLSVLYIITNNREYHTLQVGLQQLIKSYGSAAGYRWHPQTEDPDYLRIESPNVDLLKLAAAFDVTDGASVDKPGDVAAAVRRGIDFVRSKKRSYVIDMRTAQQVAGPPAFSAAEAVPPSVSQPPLDFFHRNALETAGPGNIGALIS